MDLIFDLETLGIKERNTVILSIGIVAFDIETISSFDQLVANGFYRKIDPVAQLKNGDAYSKETMEWWAKQSPKARALAFEPSKEDISVEQAFREAADWIKKSGYDYKNSYVWSRGTAFDFPKIEYRFDQIGVMPINLWKVRDIRTAIDIMTGSTNGIYELDSEFLPNFVYHHALHDCAKDAVAMQHIFSKVVLTMNEDTFL